MKIRKKTLIFLIAAGMLLSPFLVLREQANAATDPNAVPVGIVWAFDATSVALHDALLVTYNGTGGNTKIDTNDDGYISVDEAQALTGTLDMASKGLTGSLNGIENFTGISVLNLSSNNFSQTVPAGVYALPAITSINFQGNPNLTGNPALGFASNSTLTYLNVKGTGLIQAKPQVINPLTFEYDNLAANLLTSERTDLNGTVTQANIDKAKASAEYIQDPVEKQAWQDDIDLAQQMVDTSEEVTGLFTPDGGDLATGVTDADITLVKGSVDLLPDGPLKDRLNAKITSAENLLVAPALVADLLTGDKANLGDGVTQAQVNVIQSLINTLPSGAKKDALQADINIAKSLINAKNLMANILTVEKNDLKPNVTQINLTTAQTAITGLPDGTTKISLQSDLTLAQSMLDTKTQVEGLLSENNTNIAAGLTQATIQSAQTSVTTLPTGPLKNDLQTKINLAQQMLDAATRVNGLLIPDGTDIWTGITQTDVDTARTQVSALPAGTLQNELLAKVNTAQAFLDAVPLVEGLLTSTKQNLASSTTQTTINAAQTAVTILPDGTTKVSLQGTINLAQQMLNTKVHVEGLLTADGANLTAGVTQALLDGVKIEVLALPVGALQTALQAKVDIVQKLLNAPPLVNILLTADKANLGPGITMIQINVAQVAVTDLPNGATKTALQVDIDLAKALLNARSLVDALLTDDKANLDTGVTQTLIDQDRDIVTLLPEGTTKTQLLAEIDIAQKILTAKNSVYGLFDNGWKIKDAVTQITINDAKTLVNGIPDGRTKDELLALIAEAEKQLAARNQVEPVKPAEPVKPGEQPLTNPVAAQLTERGTSMEVLESVSTGDSSHMMLYMIVFLLGMAGVGYLLKRKEVKNKEIN